MEEKCVRYDQMGKCGAHRCHAEKKKLKEIVRIGVESCFYLIVLLVALEDWRNRRISNKYVLAVLLLGILFIYGNGNLTLVQRMWGSVVVSFPMLLLAMFFSGGFGGGDVKITFAYGFTLGMDRLLRVLCVGGIIAILWAFGRKWMKKEDWKEIPLGVFLAVGIFGTLFS